MKCCSGESDKDICPSNVRNICLIDAGSVTCEDVRELNIEELGDIDALALGFPCNEFSVVGEQKGFDEKMVFVYIWSKDHDKNEHSNIVKESVS